MKRNCRPVFREMIILFFAACLFAIFTPRAMAGEGDSVNTKINIVFENKAFIYIPDGGGLLNDGTYEVTAAGGKKGLIRITNIGRQGGRLS